MSLELGSDGKFNLRQSFNKNGDKVLREQRVDIKLYSKDLTKEFTLRGILIEKKELTTDVLSQLSAEDRKSFDETFTGDDLSSLVNLVNANNKGYCRVGLD